VGGLYVAATGTFSLGYYAPRPAARANILFAKLNVAGTPPVLRASGIVNSASFAQGLVRPGGLATVFVSGIPGLQGVVQAAGLPLPSELAGVSVTVGVLTAPLLAVADMPGVGQQINLQVPSELPGDITAADIVVRVGHPSPARPDDIFASQSQVSWATMGTGVFTADGHTGIFQHADYSLVTSSNPARRGEPLVLYATGLGAVTPAVASGTAAPVSPLSYVQQVPELSVDGNVAQVLFAGLTPTLAGLYQMNFVVPQQARSGSVEVVLSFPPVSVLSLPGFTQSMVTPKSVAVTLPVQ
jgi:uncharacterized protein (TIGR03437 family)